ncbi:MAG: hypothetical protein ACXW3P_05820 [Rhodospirillales bacterium]
MSDTVGSEACNVPTAIDRLKRAVRRLEAALAEHERAAAEQASRVEGMQREAAALRALQHTLAHRLDAAIARLKEAIGD